MDLEAAFAQAERGDLPAAAQTLALAQGNDPLTGAWRLALRGLVASFDPAAAAPPRPEEVGAVSAAAPEVRWAAARACVPLEHAALLAFDAEALARWVATHEAVADAAQRDLGAARLWQALLRGDPVTDEAQALFERATAARDPRLVVETAALRALGAAAADDIEAATIHARRALRMARSEGLPYTQLLAGLALARVRRLTGHPHLALHILAGVAAAAPAVWRPWIAWEATLAGAASADDIDVPGAGGPSPAVRAVRALRALLEAAHAGAHPALDQAAASLSEATQGFRDVAREAHALIALLDIVREPPDASVRAWRTGSRASIPYGLGGVAAAASVKDTSPAALACVYAVPGAAAGRLLRNGRALCGVARDLTASDAGRGGSRPDVALASLALAGPEGLDRAAFFQSVYGFRFRPELHQEMLDVLVGRMRQRLGSAGSIRRDGSAHRLALDLAEPLLVPDVRCALPVGDATLRALVQGGDLSAADVASRLGLSVRAAQLVLRQLVEDGACVPERDGRDERRVRYRVVDTSFTTITRLQTLPETE